MIQSDGPYFVGCVFLCIWKIIISSMLQNTKADLIIEIIELWKKNLLILPRIYNI